MHMNRAIQAYGRTSARRSTREQEADLLRELNARLRAARNGPEIERIRVIADNTRLWGIICGFLQDPANSLAVETRAGLISVGNAVRRAAEAASPDIDFLISVNDELASGLAG